MNLNRRHSIIADAAIIMADLCLALLLNHQNLSFPQDRLKLIFGPVTVTLVCLYLFGLLIASLGKTPNGFGNEKKDSISVILLLNSILAGLLAHLTLTVSVDSFSASIGLVAFIAIWFFLHKLVIRASRFPAKNPWNYTRIIAPVLMIPFMVYLMAAINHLTQGLDVIRNPYSDGIPLLFIATSVWALSYIPRKFVKTLLGVPMHEGAFLVFLAFDYCLRLFAM